jgi:peptidoglycan/LPS O-acetylase OafA/YrhL
MPLDSHVAQPKDPMSEQQSGATRSIDLKGTHYVALDGLRGLAILLVVVYHFGLMHQDAHGTSPGALLGFAQLGWMGVDLFFVLSGFLITGILLETKERPHYFRNFLMRRFLRIWPIYYLNLLVFFVVAPLLLNSLPEELQSMRDKQAWFWLYGANWLFAREGSFEMTGGGYFWSLAVEEQFYLVWPLVVYWCSRRSLAMTCVALFVGSAVLRVALVLNGGNTNAAYTMTFTHLEPLVMGAFLALAVRKEAGTQMLERVLAAGAVAGLAGLAYVRLADGDFFFWSRHMATYGYTLAAIVFGCMLLRVFRSNATGFTGLAFRNRFMVATGKYSYALYLAHVPIAHAIYALVVRDSVIARFGYGMTYLLFFAIALAVSWFAAWLSWHVFEKHVLRLKQYFAYQ